MKPENRQYAYEWFLHAVIGIALPFLFLTISLHSINTLFTLSSLPPWIYLCLLGVGISEVAIGTVLEKERAGIGSRLRVFLLTVFVFYLIVSIGKAGHLTERLQPTIDNVYPTVSTAVMWILTFTLHSKFRAWQQYVGMRGEKRGEQLKQQMRESVVFLTEIKRLLCSAKNTATGLFVLLTIFFLIYFAQGYRPPLVIILLTVCFLFFVFILYACIHIYLEEFFLSGQGIRVPHSSRRQRLALSMWIVGFAMVIALIVSSYRALLPAALLSRLFDWIGSWFNGGAPAEVPVSMPKPTRPIEHYLRIQELYVEQNLRLLLIVRMIIQALKKAVIAAGLAVLLLFLFGPLFSKRFRDYLGSVRWGQRLVRQLILVRQMIRQTLSALLEVLKGAGKLRDRLSRDQEKERKRRLLMKRNAYARLKRKELDTLSRQLEKVLTWAGRAARPYQSNETLGEFFTTLTCRYPLTPIEKDLFFVERLFEYARYSPEIVGRKRRRSFAVSIKRIISFHLDRDRSTKET